MDIFTTPGQQARQRINYEQRRNPAPGRCAAKSNRIRRYLTKLKIHLLCVLELTSYQTLKWLPSKYVLTDRDDESVIDWRAVTENFRSYDTDDFGLLVDLHDPGIKATNRIACVTVYKSPGIDGAQYMIRKTLYSPLPCEAWGSLPLTLAQWKIIAFTLIETRVRWQWERAVQDYTGLDTIKYAYTVGWNLSECRKPFDPQQKHIIYMGEKYDEEPAVWTGNIIYKLGINGFLNPANAGGG